MMRLWILLVLIGIVLMPGCDAMEPPPSAEPPSYPEPTPEPMPEPMPAPTWTNIVLIMADDLGYETIGANGGLSYQTPHLDALAQTGMRFTQAYSTPQCTPSRVQIMTGKYNFRNYIGFGLLDPGERTFAHLLRDAGYRTAVVGKWQLYGSPAQQAEAGRVGAWPEEAGFDEYLLWNMDDTDSRYKDPLLYANSRTPTTHAGAYGPDMFADYIHDFLERTRQEPFFLYYPMALTHRPFQPTPDHPDYDTFDTTGDNEDPAYFPSNVAYMDKIVGQIVQQLERLGLREHTLILFAGDNGTSRQITSQLGGQMIQGGKGYTTAAGTHVPFIASWPGTIQARRVNDNLVDFTDFVPTLMHVAEQTLPEDFVTDGVSFYGQLLGQPTLARSWVFCHFDPHGEHSSHRRFVQNQEWKLYQNGSLYHIAQDPDEMNKLTEEEVAALPIDILELKQDFEAVLNRLQ